MNVLEHFFTLEGVCEPMTDINISMSEKRYWYLSQGQEGGGSKNSIPHNNVYYLRKQKILI